MKRQQKGNGGVGFLGLLAAIFIALKLAGIGIVAGWSWWAVLSPIWVPWLVLAVVFCVALALALKD